MATILPVSNRELTSRARGLRLKMELGSFRGRISYRTRRRLAGRQERAGLRSVGLVEDLNMTESLLTRKIRYRRLVAPPHRPVNLCIDLSAFRDTKNAERLLAAAVYLGAAVLDMKSTQLTVTAIGTLFPVTPFSFSSLQGLKSLRKMIEALIHAPPSGYGPGQLMQAAMMVPQSHLIVVTHFLDAQKTRRLAFPWGATIIGVKPIEGGLTNQYGPTRGWLAFAGKDAVHDKMDLQYHEASAEFKKQRVAHVVVEGRRDVFDELLEVLPQRRSSSAG